MIAMTTSSSISVKPAPRRGAGPGDAHVNELVLLTDDSDKEESPFGLKI